MSEEIVEIIQQQKKTKMEASAFFPFLFVNNDNNKKRRRLFKNIQTLVFVSVHFIRLIKIE